MARPHRPLSSVTASLAGALLLLQGLVVPALDRDTGRHSPVLESEHSDATCVVGHDHTICIQVGANRAHSTPGIRFHIPILRLPSLIHGTPAPLRTVAVELAKQPRGPPAA